MKNHKQRTKHVSDSKDQEKFKFSEDECLRFFERLSKIEDSLTQAKFMSQNLRAIFQNPGIELVISDLDSYLAASENLRTWLSAVSSELKKIDEDVLKTLVNE